MRQASKAGLLGAALLLVVVSGCARKDAEEAMTERCEADTMELKAAIDEWHADAQADGSTLATAYPEAIGDLTSAGYLDVPSTYHYLVGTGGTPPTIEKLAGKCEKEDLVQPT